MSNIAKIGSLIEYTSLSKELEVIPVRLNVMGDLGLFTAEYLNSDSVVIPRITYKDYKYSDVPWGSRVKNNQNNTKDYLSLVIPHFSGEEAILPLDLRGKATWEDVINADRPEALQNVINRKMATIKQGYANTWSDAMLQLVVSGTAYAPNATISTNYYTEFAVTQTTIDVALSDETLDPMPRVQAIIDDIVDNFKGGTPPTRFMGLADRTFFDALARHPYVVNALSQHVVSQTAQILSEQLGTQGYNLSAARYQVLEFGGITWVRLPTGMTAGEARVFPTDIPDMFKLFFAPSDENFSSVNATAEQLYIYEYLDSRGQSIDIHHQSNFLTATMWPKAILRVTKS